MTFSIVACDRSNGQLGVALASSGLATGSRCPHVRAGVAAITSQCHSDWRLGARALVLAQQGQSPETILATLRESDPHFHYRQVGVVLAGGDVAACSPTIGHGACNAHLLGDGFAVLGNNIVGTTVLEEMRCAFEARGSDDLAQSLLGALEAGFAAGGEAEGQQSACLIVTEPDCERPLVDLRVEMAERDRLAGRDAVFDLRRVFDAYRPLANYYAQVWPDHPDVDVDRFLRRQVA